VALLLEEALEILLQKIQLKGKTPVPLELCYQRVLAEDIVSEIDFPSFDRSALDGYAIRMEDVRYASVRNPSLLKQVDYIPAGSCHVKKIGAGKTARIMTGAQIPEGADAIIRLEDVTVNQDIVSIFMKADNANICKQGEEIRKGDVVIKKGTILKDGALGLLAMLGHVKPLVYDQPKVAILGTGSEVIAIDQPLAPGKIRNSNSYMLMAKVIEAGCQPILLGQVVDDLEQISEKLEGHENISMYITTGGASVGDCDLMAQLFVRLNVLPLVSRIAIKPGMPVIAGYWHDALLVALAGNPAAANVSFEVLLRPLLKKMSGDVFIERPQSRAILKKAFSKPSISRRFIWAYCAFEKGVLYAEPVGYQGSGMLSGISAANALLDIPANIDVLPAGTEIDARLLVAGLL